MNKSEPMDFDYIAADGVILCHLYLRQSSSAWATEGWLRRQYGVNVSFKYRNGWYCAGWVMGEEQLDLALRLAERVKQK
jgi:hypothetical protein